MNYIGSKHKLAEFIKSNVKDVVTEDLANLIFCDLFAGTGIVSRNFKLDVKSIIANDIEYYSFVLLKNYIGNHQKIESEFFIDTLNNLPPYGGFIFENYSEGGRADRLYFSAKNGQKIDAARTQIEKWKETAIIDERLYFFLLASLLESADKVANTASVYGAFLKSIKPSAAKTLKITPAVYKPGKNEHSIYQEDGNQLIKKIQGDILYLDPPYNARQYGANYHLLNTIAKYDTFAPKGKTGLRTYYKSSYCKKNQVCPSFEEIIKEANFKYIFFSYNNEGLMTDEVIKQIMQRYGRYDLVTKDYQRFKADKTNSRHHKASSTTEYLHILEK